MCPIVCFRFRPDSVGLLCIVHVIKQRWTTVFFFSWTLENFKCRKTFWNIENIKYESLALFCCPSTQFLKKILRFDLIHRCMNWFDFVGLFCINSRCHFMCHAKNEGGNAKMHIQRNHWVFTKMKKKKTLSKWWLLRILMSINWINHFWLN